MAFFALWYPFDHRGKTMTMIPLSSLATPGFRQASPPWGHCIEISRRPFREPRGPYHLVTACSLGLLQKTPQAPSCQIKRQLVFFRAAPVFGPLLSCGVRLHPAIGLEGRGSSRQQAWPVNGFFYAFFFHGLKPERVQKTRIRHVGHPPHREKLTGLHAWPNFPRALDLESALDSTMG